MPRKSDPHAKIKKLIPAYIRYITQEKCKWIAQNRMYNVIEVMSNVELAELNRRTGLLREHVTRLAEEWWKQRGYGIQWPDDDNEPMGIYPLQTEPQHT